MSPLSCRQSQGKWYSLWLLGITRSSTDLRGRVSPGLTRKVNFDRDLFPQVWLDGPMTQFPSERNLATGH